MEDTLIKSFDRLQNGTFKKGHKFRIGLKHSEESIKKMCLSQKGNIAWNKGKKNYLSDEVRLKMKENMKGRIPWNKGKKGCFSKETISKMKVAGLGRKRPEIEKKKISDTLKTLDMGKYNKGKIQSIETIQKRVASLPSGKNHHWWKGGITAGNNKERTSLEMKLFRKACMERDNYTCQKTGIKGCKLVVHHIQNFADFPQLRTSISNGITLSKESHIEFHKIYGKKNNTREQLEEYLGRKI